MDSTDDSGRMDQRSPAPARGGSVEPANRAAVAKAVFQTSGETARERYELRDPFAEVTYHANTFGAMVTKAEQLGSSRFTAIDKQGRRTPIEKIGGTWQSTAQRAVSPDPDREASPRHGTSPAPTNVVPITREAAQPESSAPTKTVARIDAKAERAALVAKLEATLTERYIIKRAPVTVGDVTIGKTEYRFRGDSSRVAFTESTFRLATDTNSPSVARSMVDVAQARNWSALRVSGNEDFKRLVWLEASVRGVKTLGYEPNAADLEVLRREREARLVNRIEPAKTQESTDTASTAKSSTRGSGGRKAVLAAIEAVLKAKRVPESQRDAIMAAATEKLAQRAREGQSIKVKVYDKAAPSQRPVIAPKREVQRTQERPSPTR
jgi:hypothetical protein